MTRGRSVLSGCGSYLPARAGGNDELARRADTSDEWIVERTGIRNRHIAAEGEQTSDLATEAARRALADARMTPRDVDLIVLATATPDRTFPATATAVQPNPGIARCPAFAVQAVCPGFTHESASWRGRGCQNV